METVITNLPALGSRRSLSLFSFFLVLRDSRMNPRGTWEVTKINILK